MNDEWPKDKPIGKVISVDGGIATIELDNEFIGTSVFMKLLKDA